MAQISQVGRNRVRFVDAGFSADSRMGFSSGRAGCGVQNGSRNQTRDAVSADLRRLVGMAKTQHLISLPTVTRAFNLQ